MGEFKLSDLFNPEVVKAMADNAEALKSAAGTPDEVMSLQQINSCSCCCPRFLKFKFFWCYVEINNYNAECKKEKDHHYPGNGKKDC